jgi:hypothetical protein
MHVCVVAQQAVSMHMCVAAQVQHRRQPQQYSYTIWKQLCCAQLGCSAQQELRLTCRGNSNFSERIVAAVMKPVATGLNTTLKDPKNLQVLADGLAKIVPLATMKRALKTNLKPQYEAAAKLIMPQLEAYGAKAGQTVLEYLKVRVSQTFIFCWTICASCIWSSNPRKSFPTSPMVRASARALPQAGYQAAALAKQSCQHLPSNHVSLPVPEHMPSNYGSLPVPEHMPSNHGSSPVPELLS